MIVTKTPLRISFFGGGSDIPTFYENNEGMVISTSINSYIYLAINRCVASHIRVIYSQLEQVENVDDVKHDRVREALKYFEFPNHIEIASFSDVPVKGTGLGSSSTFTVGLINALYRLTHGKNIETTELAELASYIEINKCNEPIGKQDQYAAAYGGFNVMYFNGNNVRVKSLDVDPGTIYELNNNLLCFNTGINRQASSVLTKQVENLQTTATIEHTKAIVELTKNAIKLLQKRKVDDFGNLLDQSWQIKKKLTDNITNDIIDEMYDRAIRSGALGGKILGAGGGGYLLVYVPEKNKKRVIESMKNYERFNFKFSKNGSTLESI
jgi:D-glycero-alpha-D-manno-heptose-7-phosphate kinase